MRKRLGRREREVISNEFKSHLLYKTLRTPCREIEKDLRLFKYTPEEAFYECMQALDRVKEDSKEASFELRGIWDDLFCEFRDMATEGVDESELKFAASEVVYVMILYLNLCEKSAYRKICSELVCLLQLKDDEDYRRLEEVFTPNMARTDETRLKACVVEYMDSDDEWVSDDIEELLEALPDESSAENDHDTKKDESVEQFTNRQLILLFDRFFNVEFDSQSTNISAVAKFLSMVSGRSKGSIRGKIQDFDYDSEPIKKDVRFIADLIKPISPKVAERFLENIK